MIGLKSFAFERKIDTKLWTAGYQWAKSNVQAKIISQNDEILNVSVDATVSRTGNSTRKDGIITHSHTIQHEVLSALEEEKKGSTTAKRGKKCKSGTESQPNPIKKKVQPVQPSKEKASKASKASTSQPCKRKIDEIESQPNSSKRTKKKDQPVESLQSVISSTAQPSKENVAPNASTSLPSKQQIDEFEKYKQTFLQWTVSVSKKPNSINDGRCNCPAFLKEYMCKHVLGISIRMKYVFAPAEAKTVPIGQKRKRGRPSKTKPALLIQ